MGKASLKNVIQHTALPNLQIISSGPVPPNPAELLGSGKMKKIIQETHKYFDICLLDTPPIVSVTDAALIAPLTDGVLLVTSSGLTTREALKETKSLFEKINTQLLGVILNNAQPISRYSRYKEYHYHYYKLEDEASSKKSNLKLVQYSLGTILILMTIVFVDYLLDLGLLKSLF